MEWSWISCIPIRVLNFAVKPLISTISIAMCYEHFYVIYCKFWEIDTNHDQIVSKADMRMHKDGAITDLVLNRIFSRAVRTTRKDTMNLIDFTNFLLAEEDKTHPTSLEYWFRVLDEDGDGLISMYEMERFHQPVIAKLTEEGIDSMSFKDVACQMFDMICPVNGTSFQLSDLKKSPLSVRLLNALVNWRKFYTQEVTEGSERVLDETGRELSDWERFCSEEYETMMENEEEVDENLWQCVFGRRRSKLQSLSVESSPVFFSQ
ncbi:hypothetical protein TELCIR_10176 [Teladorsagia circumcincta]|uniref:EF-hand domain-containing protein n=1 Tax=Teladorsagia circumcincta TaxID=45464 RepID=A0A2G9UE90_TELCI|nr:hypothetical protein TELCIR_10176 [Teladorsagia circumcincta]